MKKIVLLILLGLFVNKLYAKKVEGQIITQNDTINVTFNIPMKLFTQEPNYERLQYRIKYYDSLNQKKILRPDQAKEIRFLHKNEEIRMLSRYNSLGFSSFFSMNSNIFLKLEIDGELKLFNYYYSENSPEMYNSATNTFTGANSYSIERYILQKGNGELKRPKRLMFRKDMMEYFSDCPELSQKIEMKELRKKDLEAIIRFYCLNCQN